MTQSCVKSIVVAKYKETEEPEENEKLREKMVFLQYRGKVTEKFKYSLKTMKLPIEIITQTFHRQSRTIGSALLTR